MKKKALNIGSGFKKKESDEEYEWINIDVASEVEPDNVVDIEKGLPFKDNTFDLIYSQHCLEHIRPEYFRFVLDEMARVTKEEGIWDLELPFDNPATRTNYDHYRTFSFMSFNTLLLGDQRSYYTNFRLIQLHRKVTKLEKLFFYMFPFFKKNIFYKFKIVKNGV